MSTRIRTPISGVETLRRILNEHGFTKEARTGEFMAAGIAENGVMLTATITPNKDRLRLFVCTADDEDLRVFPLDDSSNPKRDSSMEFACNEEPLIIWAKQLAAAKLSTGRKPVKA